MHQSVNGNFETAMNHLSDVVKREISAKRPSSEVAVITMSFESITRSLRIDCKIYKNTFGTENSVPCIRFLIDADFRGNIISEKIVINCRFWVISLICRWSRWFYRNELATRSKTHLCDSRIFGWKRYLEFCSFESVSLH